MTQPSKAGGQFRYVLRYWARNAPTCDRAEARSPERLKQAAMLLLTLHGSSRAGAGETSRAAFQNARTRNLNHQGRRCTSQRLATGPSRTRSGVTYEHIETGARSSQAPTSSTEQSLIDTWRRRAAVSAAQAKIDEQRGAQLVSGWRAVPSNSQPGEVAYEHGLGRGHGRFRR